MTQEQKSNYAYCVHCYDFVGHDLTSELIARFLTLSDAINFADNTDKKCNIITYEINGEILSDYDLEGNEIEIEKYLEGLKR